MRVYAQTVENPVLDPRIRGLTGMQFIDQAIRLIVTWLIVLAVIFFTINIIVAGTNWINSGGDKNKIETARKQLTYAFTGLIVIFCVFAALRLMGTVAGIPGLQILNLTIPTL